MMTVTENAANTTPQFMDRHNYAVNHSYPIPTYNYRHQNSWEKSNYAILHHHHHQTPLLSTGGISSLSKFYQPSFDIMSNLNNTNSNFYRRHTESTLPTPNPIYVSSTPNHPSNVPFHYSHHSSEPLVSWNNASSLMRTQSASYQDYSTSTPHPPYNPINMISSQLTTNLKAMVNSQLSQIASDNHYSSFHNIMPPMNFSLLSSSSVSNHMIVPTSKHLIPSKINKRSRLTAQIRNEILKFKANNPSLFVWEIQQNLLLNGICTAQTLPNASAIRRVLNKSLRNSVAIKEEPRVNVNLPTTVKNSSPVTICLSPSPSPTLSNGESISECSICLESYRSGQEVSILACSHEYHSSCIGEWMLKNRSCPMCRKDIRDQPQFVTLLI